MAAAIMMISGCGKSSYEYDGAVVGEYSTIHVDGDLSFDYLLYMPDSSEKLPLVIVFHGYGEGVDLINCKITSTLASAESQAAHPCYVLAPIIEDNTYLAAMNREMLYDALMNSAKELVDAGKVDADRIYTMGNSFGGLGTVEFAETFPDEIAAALSMCPALSYDNNSVKNLDKMKDVPVMFAHATNDEVIPVDTSRTAVFTLQLAGATEVYLKEFTDQEMLDAGAYTGYHQADFAVMADDNFMNWLFEHKASERK